MTKQMLAFSVYLIHDLIYFGHFIVSLSQENVDPNIVLTFHKSATLKFELFFIWKWIILKLYFQT